MISNVYYLRLKFRRRHVVIDVISSNIGSFFKIIYFHIFKNLKHKTLDAQIMLYLNSKNI